MQLSQRVLNRALLDRQFLLDRVDLGVTDATRQLLGLNAQDPNIAYLALWNRLAPFTLDDLTAAIEDGRLVRSTLMRSTQHLVTAADFGLVRPLVAPLLRRVQRTTFGSRTTGIDLGRLVADAEQLLADGNVMTRPALGRALAVTRPGADPVALGWSVQYLLPVIHPAPSGTWNKRGATPFALGVRREATAADARELVRRYLAAFGPATVSDARVWSGISGLREIFEQLRPELVVRSDESGRELFDLPGRHLPDEDQPAPVRFLAEFDATLLGHADRTRIMTDEIRRAVCVGSGVAATVLIDGFVAATWTVHRARGTATLTVRPFAPVSRSVQAAVESEAAALLAFTDPTATHTVEFAATSR